MTLEIHGPWPGGRPPPAAAAGNGWELWACPACRRDAAARHLIAALCAELGPAAPSASATAIAAASAAGEPDLPPAAVERDDIRYLRARLGCRAGAAGAAGSGPRLAALQVEFLRRSGAERRDAALRAVADYLSSPHW
jgi:hypothetical protein